MIKFLFGVEPDEVAEESETAENNSKTRKKWTAAQSREFGELYRAMAYMILSCDLRQMRDSEGRLTPRKTTSACAR